MPVETSDVLVYVHMYMHIFRPVVALLHASYAHAKNHVISQSEQYNVHSTMQYLLYIFPGCLLYSLNFALILFCVCAYTYTLHVRFSLAVADEKLTSNCTYRYAEDIVHVIQIIHNKIRVSRPRITFIYFSKSIWFSIVPKSCQHSDLNTKQSQDFKLCTRRELRALSIY